MWARKSSLATALACPSRKARKASIRFALASILTMSAGLATSAQTGSIGATEELPPGALQQKATTACTECHEARIIVQQRLSKVVWGKEVDKMIKWGAVVDSADHDALIEDRKSVV